jgi:hypothetical protein
MRREWARPSGGLTTTCSCQRGGGVFRSVRLNIQMGAGQRAAALQLKSIR